MAKRLFGSVRHVCEPCVKVGDAVAADEPDVDELPVITLVVEFLECLVRELLERIDVWIDAQPRPLEGRHRSCDNLTWAVA